MGDIMLEWAAHGVKSEDTGADEAATEPLTLTEAAAVAASPAAEAAGGGDGGDADTEPLAPPRRPEEHQRNYHMKLAFCHLYGIFLVTFGTLLSVCDAYFIQSNVTPAYCVILCCVGLAYLLLLTADVWLQARRREKPLLLEPPAGADRAGGRLTSGDVPEPPASYSYDLSPHGNNFYLKLGAAVFAMGHLVHALLRLVLQLSAGPGSSCLDRTQLAMDVVYPLYSFLQLLFVFNYNNLIVNRHKMTARFGFMHLIGTSVTLWVSSIARETMLALALHHGIETNVTASPNTMDSNAETHKHCFEVELSPVVAEMFRSYSPYLFPFTVELNIIMVCFFLIIWLNIGRNPPSGRTHYSLVSSPDSAGSMHSMDAAEEPRGRFVVHADCGSSGLGAAGGFLLAVLTAAHLIVGFVLASSDLDSYHTLGARVADGTRLLLHATLLAAVLAAFPRTRALHVDPRPRPAADDVLLLVCVPGFIVDATFTAAASVIYLNVLKSVDAIVNLTQSVLQTAFIVDRLRRCSDSRELRARRPGRQLVTLLLAANVCVWLLNTFTPKAPAAGDERHAFYGEEAWTVIGHVCLPLIMFYRFHSSACLADIWQLAYQSSAH